VARIPPPPRRLPGVLFEAPPPAPDEALPRMDIAFFAGFADRGPLERATAVESLAQFEALYGSQIVLARDADSGEPVRGLLHPCVRSFFSQGGRRCWILRVAGSGVEHSSFPLAALVRAERDAGTWRLTPATLRAADAGSGADALRVAPRLAARPLRVRPLRRAGDRFVLDAAASVLADLRIGDLLWLPLDTLRLHGRIDGLALDGARCDVTVGPWCALAATEASPAPEPSGLLGEDTTSPPSLTGFDWESDGRLRIRLRRAAPWPQVGTAIGLRFADAPDGWMHLEQLDVLSPPDREGLAGIELLGRPWLQAAPEPALGDWLARGDEVIARRLRLDVQVREGGGDPVLASDLPLTAPAGATAFGLSDPMLFPLAGDSVPEERMQLWLPLADLAGFDEGLAPLPSTRTPLERDGLDRFDWPLFAEPALAPLPADVLADQAEALRLSGERPRPLHGLHALLGGSPEALGDEPTLLAIPDAVHAGWDRSVLQPAWQWLPQQPQPPDPEAGESFRDCDATPLPAPVFVQGGDPDATGQFTLAWTQVLPGATYTLEEAADEGFATAGVIHEGPVTRFTVLGKRPGAVYYRVRAALGTRGSPWSQGVRINVGVLDYATRPWRDDTLLELHRLMLRCAAGRGDLLAVLALPPHYDMRDAAEHAERLRESVGDDRTLSHGALYHPWMVIRRVDTILRFPPDGAACGQLAESALRRGAWVAVAHKPLRDVVALTPPGMAPSVQQRQQSLDAQVNLLRSAPIGFIFSSADTLTRDSAWRPVNVRRLMCLLRRLALRRGTAYVFEPNGPVLRRTVERGFTAVLDDLFRRGAFAGARPADGYRVEAGDEVNTPPRRDAGQFWVQLKVAPALPLSFLTVRLAREGERVLSRELH
jgi:hypothetical protein